MILKVSFPASWPSKRVAANGRFYCCIVNDYITTLGQKIAIYSMIEINYQSFFYECAGVNSKTFVKFDYIVFKYMERCKRALKISILKNKLICFTSYVNVHNVQW